VDSERLKPQQRAPAWGDLRESTSDLSRAYPEACAALAAARRAGRVTAAHDPAVAELAALKAELVIVGVDEALARCASELTDDCALRGCERAGKADGPFRSIRLIGLPGDDNRSICRRFRGGREPGLDPREPRPFRVPTTSARRHSTYN
jgi:hypothetical protein